MPMNKQKGDMYPFVTHTWNPIRGTCPHNCSYCYMKGFGNLGPLRLEKKELKTNLGEGNFIFVGSSTDMWLADQRWLWQVLATCSKFENTYLFQTKNPCQFTLYSLHFPKKYILGATIESNRSYPKISRAPFPEIRMACMYQLSYIGHRTMITIEPILDFDLEAIVEWIKCIKPEWVNIGADSKGHNLPEPPPEKVKELIEELKGITEVKLKSNLKRLYARKNPT